MLPARRDIYEHVHNHPGIHLRALVRGTGYALGTVEHHLRLLLRHGLIETRFAGPHRRCYFPRGAPTDTDPRLVALARTPALRRVLRALAEADDLDARELAERVGCTAATAAYHLKRLHTWGVVETLRIARSRVFRLQDPAEARRALEAPPDPLERFLGGNTPDPVFAQLLERIPPATSPTATKRTVHA